MQKRLTDSPRLDLRDTGTPSFEGLVIEELVAWRQDRLARPEAFFWRTQAGAEVDLRSPAAGGWSRSRWLAVAVGPRGLVGSSQSRSPTDDRASDSPALVESQSS